MFTIVSFLAKIHILLSWHPRTWKLSRQLEEKKNGMKEKTLNPLNIWFLEVNIKIKSV